jgi:hypothetical protein
VCRTIACTAIRSRFVAVSRVSVFHKEGLGSGVKLVG